LCAEGLKKPTILPGEKDGGEGGTLAKTKQQVCLICGKPSAKTICDACSDRLRGEALEKKKKEEKI
jgi:hypothetical protein